MMDPIDARKLLLDLQRSERKSREFDFRIAKAAGFQPEVTALQGSSSGKWITPDGRTIEKIPFYSRSIDDCYGLLDMLAPGRAVAFKWTPEQCSATIDGGASIQAHTLTLALCALAVWIILENQSIART
jgi:hypothetical protein